MGTVATVVPAVLQIAELQNKFLKVVYNAFKFQTYSDNNSNLRTQRMKSSNADADIKISVSASVVRGLLEVPATSTSSERFFSLAGRTLEERRSQLSGPSVDGLLFLHGLK